MVIATEPEFTLPGDIHRASSLDLVTCAVGGGNNQLHFARIRQRGFAQQQATAVAFAGTHSAQVLDRGLVVVGIKAADHALACAGDHPRRGTHLQGNSLLWLTTQIQSQRLELDLLAAGEPVFGLDSRQHGRGPQGARAAQGLHLAIRIGIARLQQQVHRLLARCHLGQRGFTAAVFVQAQGQLVGDHARIGAAVF